MNKLDEIYIDGEVRIRLLEQSIDRLDNRLYRMESKIDSHFKWTIGTILGFMAANVGLYATIFFGILPYLKK
jgi:hypothetical protein